jgi:hypothetical protein
MSLSSKSSSNLLKKLASTLGWASRLSEGPAWVEASRMSVASSARQE